MSHSLNSLKGGYIGDYLGEYHRGIKGDTRSLDYSTCKTARDLNNQNQYHSLFRTLILCLVVSKITSVFWGLPYGMPFF